jgi:hypothetical protein
MPARQGLIAIGVVNIVLGSILTMVSGAVLAAVTFLAIPLSAVGSTKQAPIGFMGVIAGMFALLIGVVFLFSIMLIVAGVGVLKRARWGRILSLIYAIASLSFLMMMGFSSLNTQGMVTAGYSVLLLVLLNLPEWKAEFASTPRYAPPPPPPNPFT